VKRAVLLLNLGGPQTQDQVKSFLFRLFFDPEIIRIPFDPLRALVAWLIATLRLEKSKALYRKIGGGSPIRRLTDEQARNVERRLTENGRDVVVRTAFSCSEPLIEDVVKELRATGVERFLALPLYPQYSLTTTKGALERVQRAVPNYYEIRSYPTHPAFLEAHADLINKELTAFSTQNLYDVHLLFSAHSIPEKLITQLGDPYRNEVEQSVRAVIEKLGWKGQYHLSWQSKLGPVKWLAPATSDEIKRLGSSGVRRVVVIPIAFVTDHIETLEEIDVELKQVAQEAGIAEFRRTPGLNSHPAYIECLRDLTNSHAAFWTD
jgi:protoporphyrin/coproporphyrin ferrochelatase